MDEFVKLAKQTLEAYVKTGERLPPPQALPAGMDRRAPVFVSLKKHGNLRGCIGSLEPTLPNVAEEIARYAVIAGTQDPRFPPVRAEELDDLVYSVDVLGDAEPVRGIEELDAKAYGVIVSRGGRRGVLLPNLEGVDTPEEQIGIALDKAGISPRESYTIERFRVERHK
jgi:AmmeMemoRadiSam system protein A